jgi:hypothetical protein
MTNYQQFALEISKTDSLEDLQRIEGKLVRFYNWQVINEKELARLDIKL